MCRPRFLGPFIRDKNRCDARFFPCESLSWGNSLQFQRDQPSCANFLEKVFIDLLKSLGFSCNAIPIEPLVMHIKMNQVLTKRAYGFISGFTSREYAKVFNSASPLVTLTETGFEERTTMCKERNRQRGVLADGNSPCHGFTTNSGAVAGVATPLLKCSGKNSSRSFLNS